VVGDKRAPVISGRLIITVSNASGCPYLTEESTIRLVVRAHLFGPIVPAPAECAVGKRT